MSNFVTADMSSILLPDGLKSVIDESDSDFEEGCDIQIPFANISDINLKSDSNELALQQSQDIDTNIGSDVSLTIHSDDVNKINFYNNSPIVTPKKSCESSNNDPVTPTANLKMLMNVLSPMIRDRENQKRFNNLIEAAEKSREECVSEANDLQGDEENDKSSGCTNRKAKSLGLLCQKFLSRYPDYPEDGQVLAIPLDTVSKDLNVERRRIYDIVNVLESVEMVSRRAKNKYVWHGKANLLSTLTRLQEIGEKENYQSRMTRLRDLQLRNDFEIDLKILAKKKPLSDCSNTQNSQSNIKNNVSEEKVDSRKEKSLGVMSQKFIMLFLVSKDSRLISLDDAARILIGDENFLIDESSKLKTKVRRLYDIANILTSLDLIKKVHVTETRGRKPAFKWIGPHPDHTNVDIKTITAEKRPVTKHSLLCSVPSPDPTSRKTWGRHSSFNVMCDVVEKERKAFSSAPSTPVKEDEALNESFKADFAALKRKYPDQVSSLVSKNLCSEERKAVEKTATSVALSSSRITKNVSNGSGPCRALFGEPTDANSPVKFSEILGTFSDQVDAVSSNCDEKQDRTTKSKRAILLPNEKELLNEPVLKKSRTDVDAITLLQQHGFTKAQLDSLMKEGTMLKVVRVIPGTDVMAEPTAVNKEIQENQTKLNYSSDVDLLCQEKISPLTKKKGFLKDDACIIRTGHSAIPEITGSPASMHNGSSCHNMCNLSSGNLNDTPIKPDSIDITKFPNKKLYNNSPKLITTDSSSPILVTTGNSSPSLVTSVNSSPRLVTSQGRYLLSWMTPLATQCQSTCGTSVPVGGHTTPIHKNSQPVKLTDVSLLPPSPHTIHNPVMARPVLIPHQVTDQFRCQLLGPSPIMTTTTSSTVSSIPSRISPVPPRTGSYRYSYIPPSHHDASSLLKGLGNLSPIQPTTKPNPYITPPSGSLMQSVVSGLTAYQSRITGNMSQSIQRQLTLKTPDSKK